MAGNMRNAMRRTPGCVSNGGHAGRKPSFHSSGNCTSSCRSPPSSTPTAMARIVGWPMARNTGMNARPPAIMPRLRNIGASAGTEKRRSAFSMPIAAAARATIRRNGSMTRDSRMVSSTLPGILAKPGASSGTSHGVMNQPTIVTRASATASAFITCAPRRHASARPRR